VPTPQQVWTYVPVYGTFLNIDLTPVQGSVVFRIRNVSRIANGVVVPSQQAITLDANGHFSANIYASTDPNLTPAGWAYEIVESFGGGRPPYSLIIPISAANTGIDISTITPLYFSAPENGEAQLASANAKVSQIAAANSATLAAASALAANTSAAAASAAITGAMLGQKLSANLVSVAHVVTANLAAAETFYFTPTEDVTGWVFQNPPPVGKVSTVRLIITQNLISAKTVANPANNGTWAISTSLGSTSILDLSIDSNGSSILFTGPAGPAGTASLDANTTTLIYATANTANNNSINLAAHVANVANPHTVTKAQVGLSNVDNTSDVNKPVSTAQATALALKAPQDSAGLTGIPTAPTATPGTNTTQLATTAFVATAAPVTNLGESANTIAVALTSSTGTGTAILTANTTKAGVTTSADYNRLVNTSGTNTGDQTTVSGLAGSATVLATPRTIAVSGAVVATATSFDGSGNISIPVTSVDLTSGSLSGVLGTTHLGSGVANSTTVLYGDQTYKTVSGGGGPVNLGESANATVVSLTSSTGTGTAIPTANSTAAGITTAADYNRLVNTSGTNTGDQTFTANLGESANATVVSLTSSSGTGNTILTANSTAAGVTTAADYTRLVNTSGTNTGDQATNLGETSNTIAIALTSSTGSGTAILTANTTKAGVTTSADYNRLVNTSGTNTGDQTFTANLGESANTTAVLLTSSSGTGTAILTANSTAAGVTTAADYSRLVNSSGTNTGDQATNLAETSNTIAISITSSTGTGAAILTANSTKAGVTTSSDYNRLVNTSGTNTGDQTTVSGNAGSATVLATPRTIAVSGAVVATATFFDGSGNISLPVTSIDLTSGSLSGVLGTAHLGSGVANSTTVLYGDQTYKTLPTAAATNLGESANATVVSLTSSTGTGNTILTANSTAAGVTTAADYNRLVNTSGTNTGDQTFTANIGESANATVVTLTSSAGSGNTILTANSTAAGVTTAADFTRLVNTSGTNTGDQATNLGRSANSTVVSITSSTGSGNTILTANSTAAGVTTSADYNRLVNTSGTNTGDQTTISGLAGSATVLATPRTIAVSGAVVATATNFDGSAAINLPVTSVDLTAAAMSGVLGTAHLGSGVANSTTILYGDQTYKSAPTGTTNLGESANTIAAILTSSTGTGTAILTANSTAAGVTTAADYTRLVNTSGTNTGDQTTISGNAGTATNIAGGATSRIVYQTAASTTGFITTVNNGVLVTSATGVPTISATLPSALTSNSMLVTVTATVSAAGSTQGTATALTTDFNVATTVAASAGVVLPATTVGQNVWVDNKGANALTIYPPSGSAIDNLAVNAGYSLAINAGAEFKAANTTQWYSFGAPGVASSATNISGGAVNQVVYQTAGSTTGFIATVNSGVLVTSGAGVPSISTSLPATMVTALFTNNLHPSYTDFTVIADPAAPGASTLRVYGKDVGGRMMPKWIGPSGLDTPFQPFIGFNNVRQLAPGGGASATTVFSALGCGYTAVATTSASPVPATGSLLTRTVRSTLATTTTAGAVASLRMNTVQCSVETGFFFATRWFGAGTLQVGQRTFHGLMDSSAAATNIDPLADTTRAKLGVGCNVNTGNWFLITNTSGSAPTTTDLSTDFPQNTTSLYELVMFCKPGVASVSYRLSNLTTNATPTTGTIAANLPGSTVMLDYNSFVTNNATAAASTIGIVKVYLETDY
jgi:hypothetical protein